MTPNGNDENKMLMEDSDLLESYDPEQFRLRRQFKDGVYFLLRPVTPEELQSLYDSNSVQVWDPEKKQKVNKLTEAGEILFVKMAIKGWEGLTWEILDKWIIGWNSKAKGKSGPVEFKVSTAWTLMKKVNKLQPFIFDTVTNELEMSEIQAEQTKNS